MKAEYEAEFVDEDETEAKLVKKKDKSKRGPVERVVKTAIHAAFWLAIAMLACKAFYGVTLW